MKTCLILVISFVLVCGACTAPLWWPDKAPAAAPIVVIQQPAPAATAIREPEPALRTDCPEVNANGQPLTGYNETTCFYMSPTQMAPAATAIATNAPAVVPQNDAPATVTFTCDGQSLVYPAGSVVFPFNVWRNNVAYHDCHYDVVFDASQSGYFGVEPHGWAHQPWLPGSNREYHEGAITMPADMIRYLGPECRVYRNSAGNDSTAGFNGELLLDRTNGITDISMSATPGHGNEVWLWVACNESDASGFSMSVLK